MTKIKLCGLSREPDIAAANALKIDCAGFVFAPRSRRYVSPERAAELRRLLDAEIRAVGVFVDEEPEVIAGLLNRGVIDLAQLHGREDAAYITRLRALTPKPILQAFRIVGPEDADLARESTADGILLDSGTGSGAVFDWELVKGVKRPYFLAGGLSPENVAEAVARLRPFGVDVSSGIETDGVKDTEKMAAFVAAVREVDRT